MADPDSERYWDERARENALYFVDNEIDYASPDVATFWRRGEEVVDRLCDLVGLTLGSDEVVVDIGCGVGRLTRALAARTRRVVGVDVSGEMLALARRYNAEIPNIEWRHGDGRGLSVVEDGSVDGCLSHVVFQHIPDPSITLNYVREMGRVLRPGGWALFVLSTDPRIHQPRQSLRRRLAARLRGDRDARDERAWWGSAVEVGALRAAARDGGLEIERLLEEGSQFTTVLARCASSKGHARDDTSSR